MSDKVALVTGGARGIGRTIVKTLVDSGYMVVANYNNSEARAKSLQDELGDRVYTYKADISNEVEVKAMVDDIVARYGRIDVLVNNAAVCIDSLFQDKTVENFRKTLDTNVVGTFVVSRYVANVMYANKKGCIVNMASTNGINTYFPMCIDYDASKAAIISLTHNLAMQYAPYIRVNAIAPGFIATESEIKDMDEDFIRQEEEKILLRRAGTELDVAKLVRFLCSEDSEYINNEVIRIDGGMYGNS